MNTFFKHRVIILNRGSMPRNRTGGITSLETARSLANDPSLLRENYVFCVPRREWYCSVSYLSLFIGGVCGRSLTPGKILFGGRQTCSLYLALGFMTLCFLAMHIFSVQKKQSTSSSNLHQLVI